VLTDFFDYNEFLDVADAALEELGLDGFLQVASFRSTSLPIPMKTTSATTPTARRTRRCTCCAKTASTARSRLSRSVRYFRQEYREAGTTGPRRLGQADGEAMSDLPIRPDTPCVAVCSTTLMKSAAAAAARWSRWRTGCHDAEQKEVVWQRILAQGYPRRNT
jgi:hypothetical protein